MDITRKLIEWCDNKYDEAIHEEDDRKVYIKAGVSGFVEGLMDGAIVMFIPLCITCLIYSRKLSNK
mgnify:CR=1 FL=1